MVNCTIYLPLIASCLYPRALTTAPFVGSTTCDPHVVSSSSVGSRRSRSPKRSQLSSSPVTEDGGRGV